MLVDEVRKKIRLRHYSYRTEQAYVAWVKRYVRFHKLTHPNNLGDDAIEEFLAYLATTRGVSASTQNQALAALLSLYQHVLGKSTQQLTFTRRALRNVFPSFSVAAKCWQYSISREANADSWDTSCTARDSGRRNASRCV